MTTSTWITPISQTRSNKTHELWQHRQLIFFLAWRDIQLRYTQSILGVMWIAVQPLITMLIFNVLFGILLGQTARPTQPGIPYTVSTFCALVPWQFFSRSLNAASLSLVANQHIITRIYFPRLVLPIAATLAVLIDFSITLLLFFFLMLSYGIMPHWQIVFLPFFILLAGLTSLAFSCWLSALNAMYRDVHHTMGFVLQMWLYATPVLYTVESMLHALPPWARILYGLNPMLVVIEGFRWSLLGDPIWAPMQLLCTTILTLLLLCGGIYFFKRLENFIVEVV